MCPMKQTFFKINSCVSYYGFECITDCVTTGWTVTSSPDQFPIADRPKALFFPFVLFQCNNIFYFLRCLRLGVRTIRAPVTRCTREIKLISRPPSPARRAINAITVIEEQAAGSYINESSSGRTGEVLWTDMAPTYGTSLGSCGT